MSLDNNFLPKTHAGGGMSDIEYKYIIHRSCKVFKYFTTSIIEGR